MKKMMKTRSRLVMGFIAAMAFAFAFMFNLSVSSNTNNLLGSQQVELILLSGQVAQGELYCADVGANDGWCIPNGSGDQYCDDYQGNCCTCSKINW